MSIQWSDLLTALGLLLVLEGIMPFLNPAAVRSLARKLESISDTELRWGGLLLMLVGVAVLFLAR